MSTNGDVPTASAAPRAGVSSPAPKRFYSTMRKSRNPYISMKTKDRCHFYSTMKPGDLQRPFAVLPSRFSTSVPN
jgi:hypothetical protein